MHTPTYDRVFVLFIRIVCAPCLLLGAVRRRQHPERIDGGAAARVKVIASNRHHVRVRLDVGGRAVYDATLQRRKGGRDAAKRQQHDGGCSKRSAHVR